MPNGRNHTAHCLRGHSMFQSTFCGILAGNQLEKWRVVDGTVYTICQRMVREQGTFKHENEVTLGISYNKLNDFDMFSKFLGLLIK